VSHEGRQPDAAGSVGYAWSAEERRAGDTSKGRLEAFSDGVLAIVITIMVLELRPPEGTTFQDLAALWPKFLSYALSFVSLAIYWVNHHHLFQAARLVNGRVLWANLLVLFFLSLVPFATAWMGEHSFAPIPVALYGVSLTLPAIGYFFLVRALIAVPGQPPTIATGIGRDVKGKLSIVIYVFAIPVALVFPLVAVAVYFLVAGIWIAPDPRIERALRDS
jgi:TMEM175 potassium channel family protein